MATKRKRRLSAKQRAALARGRAIRRRKLGGKTRRKTTRRRTTRTTTTRRRTTARRTTRSSPVARRKRTTRRRSPSRSRRRSFGGGVIPAGAPKQVALGTAGFIGTQLIVDKAPIPAGMKTGNGRLFAKVGAAILLGFALKKVVKMSAADAKAVTIGGLMSPALDVAGTMLAKVGGLSGASSGNLGEVGDEFAPLQLPDAGGDEDELIALANRLAV